MVNTKTQPTSPARTFQTINPYEGHSVAQAASITADVHQAQIAWRRAPFNVRSALMAKAAQVIRDNRARYARLMTNEMGKTVTDALGELEKCAFACEYFAAHAEGFLKPIPYDMSAGHVGPNPAPRAFVTFNPVGHPGSDAVEFPVLAGAALRGTTPHGRQWRSAKARFQRSRLRARR